MPSYSNPNPAPSAGLILGIVSSSTLALAVITALLMWGCPLYSVYKARQEGLAVQAHANGAREAIVAQATAELEAAQKRADAIKIMGQAAKDFPEYRQQEFIGAFAEAIKDHAISQIIYVPTEANIPITEAGRHAGVSK